MSKTLEEAIQEIVMRQYKVRDDPTMDRDERLYRGSELAYALEVLRQVKP